MKKLTMAVLGFLTLCSAAQAGESFWLCIGKGVRVEQRTQHAIVAIGAPLKVFGSCGPVLALGGSVQVYGVVEGAVLAIGSPVHVYPGGRIDGKLSVWRAKLVRENVAKLYNIPVPTPVQ